jgi:hypothetical protein
MTSVDNTLFGVDATLIPSQEEWRYWVSSGFRSTFTESNALWLPYVEAGGWLVANLGLGATLAIAEGQGTSLLGHAFIGLPVGSFGDAPAIYLEPYYRPMYGALRDEIGLFHEGGLLLKFGRVPVKLNLRW